MRKIMALTAAAALAVTLSTVSLTPAQARGCVMPELDTQDVVITPVTVLGVSETETVIISVGLYDPCNRADKVLVTIANPGAEGAEYDLFDLDGVDLPDGYHGWGLDLEVPPGGPYNGEAGTWTAEFHVYDTDAGTVSSLVGPTFRVVRAAKLTNNAAPEPVKKGKTITVTGSLDRANWETSRYGAYAGKSVELQYRTKTTSYAGVKTLTTNGSGDVKTTVKATKDGYFRLVYAGNSTTAAVKGTGDYVDVT